MCHIMECTKHTQQEFLKLYAAVIIPFVWDIGELQTGQTNLAESLRAQL